MKRGIVALLVASGFASPLHAAPGDPRLVQGVLEWPARLTVEPFVVIRGDDGRWYYAEVKGVKRLESSPLTAGGRVAVLGTEAARPYEITAIALGSGDAATLALALMPHVNAASGAPGAPTVAPHPPGSPKPAATDSTPKNESAATSKAEPSPLPKAEVLRAPQTVAKGERTAATPAATPTPATASAPIVAPGSAAGITSAGAATPTAASAPAATPAVSPSTKTGGPPVSDSPAATAPRVVESSAPVPPIAEKAMSAKGADAESGGDGPRWTELRGTVKVIAGNWIVVRTDNGQLVLVDLSTVRGGATSLRPGVTIALYGTPTDQKFQAMGIIQPENRPATKPATVPPRR